jgi:hypothetical protein
MGKTKKKRSDSYKRGKEKNVKNKKIIKKVGLPKKVGEKPSSEKKKVKGRKKARARISASQGLAPAHASSNALFSFFYRLFSLFFATYSF